MCKFDLSVSLNERLSILHTSSMSHLCIHHPPPCDRTLTTSGCLCSWWGAGGSLESLACPQDTYKELCTWSSLAQNPVLLNFTYIFLESQVRELLQIHLMSLHQLFFFHPHPGQKGVLSLSFSCIITTSLFKYNLSLHQDLCHYSRWYSV